MNLKLQYNHGFPHGQYNNLGFQGGAVVKNLHANAGNARDAGSLPRLGRSPGVGNGNLLLPGKCHGQRSLVGYRRWGHKESDTTEHAPSLMFTGNYH